MDPGSLAELDIGFCFAADAVPEVPTFVATLYPVDFNDRDGKMDVEVLPEGEAVTAALVG